MRKVPFVKDEYYHIYNRGVDKRKVFMDEGDFKRFVRSIKEFNSLEPIGSIYLNSLGKNKPKHQLRRPTSQLIEIVAYCLIPNHYHFILKENGEGGVSEFMKRLGGGYTKYFNKKYKRSGALFQGRFKSTHIKTDSKLAEYSAYVNLNHKVHAHKYPLRRWTSQWSSWREYVGKVSKKNSICEKGMILSHFRSRVDYKKFAESTVRDIVEQRIEMED
jgi:putative transposase